MAMFDQSEQLKSMQRMEIDTGIREYRYPNNTQSGFAYRALEKELEDKKRQKESEKKEERESLKKLIAYYFNR